MLQGGGLSIRVFFTKKARRVVVIFADTHGGHKLGLLSPDTVLFEEDEEGNPVEYKPGLTAVQQYLWRCFEEDLTEVKRLAAGAPLVLIHAGDLTWGNKYPEQLVSTRQADQVTIAVDNMGRALELPNVVALRLVFGTGSHTFLEGSATLLVAGQLRAGHRDLDIRCLAHGLFSIDGITVDCAHHGPSPGIRHWTAGNQLRYYTRSVMMQSVTRGEAPPRILVRAHRHTGCRETVRVEKLVTEAFLLPSYSGLSEHARKVTQSKHLIGNGLLVLEIEEGQLMKCHTLWRTVDLRTREEL